MAAFGVWATHTVLRCGQRGACSTRDPALCPARAVPSGTPREQVPSLHPLRSRSLGVVRGVRRYYAPVRLLTPVHHRLRLLAFPMRTGVTRHSRPDVRPPRFRRDPFVRDGVFDHGRASAPRVAVPHMLPSTSLTVSASADFCFSRLNSPPHTIAVYASRPPSPTDSRNTYYQAGATPYLGRSRTGGIAPASWRTSDRSGGAEVRPSLSAGALQAKIRSLVDKHWRYPRSGANPSEPVSVEKVRLAEGRMAASGTSLRNRPQAHHRSAQS